MLKKARQGKHGRHTAILSRWYANEEYRKSLSAMGWKGHHIMLYDRNAVEKHIYIATRVERIQFLKHWILMINAEGPQLNDPTLLKRKENANDCTTSSWQGPKKNTGPFLAVNKYDGEKDHNLRATKNMTTRLTLETGWRFYKGSLGNLQTTSSGSRANLQPASSLSSTWDRTHWDTSSWNSQHSSSPDDW